MQPTERLPDYLSLNGASFFSTWGRVSNVLTGVKNGSEFVVFDYDSNSGETAHTDTVVGVRTTSPSSPVTSLSRASGIRIERVGDWVFAYEPERTVPRSQVAALLDDVYELLEYARAFPQNM